MIKRIAPESYLPVNYQNNPKVMTQAWHPHEGDQVYYHNKLYVVIDTDTDMGGNRTIALVRIHKVRWNIFPWAHLTFFRDVDFHKLTLPAPGPGGLATCI